MSTYKRLEMWLYGNCPNCKERKLISTKPKKPKPSLINPIHLKCLSCGTKYYYPLLWQSVLLFIVMIIPRIIMGTFDFTDFGFGLRLALLFIITMPFLMIGFPLLPKKPYIVDEAKVVKWENS